MAKRVVVLDPPAELAAFKQLFLDRKDQLDGHNCVLHVDRRLGRAKETEHLVIWLFDTFDIDVHAPDGVGRLRFEGLSPHTARILHIRYGFNVNMPITTWDLRNDTYAESWLKYPAREKYPYGVEAAEMLVWCGAHATNRTHSDWNYLFRRRAACARACRALIWRRFQPPGGLSRDLRTMLAQALWETRVGEEWGVWKK